MDFSQTIVVYDTKLVDAVNQMSTWSFKNTKGHGHLLTIVQGHSDATVSNFFSLETPMPIEARFHVEPYGMGEWKWVQLVYVTWPRWPPCPYVVKTFKNLLLWNENADDLETFYTAQAQPNLFKW